LQVKRPDRPLPTIDLLFFRLQPEPHEPLVPLLR
jgi:hypothetical protein